MPEILEELNQKKTEFRISSISVEMTTLDEVFDAAGSKRVEEVSKTSGGASSPDKSSKKPTDWTGIDPELVLEKNRTLGLQPRDFSRQFSAVLAFRVSERFGTFSRTISFVVGLALGMGLLWLMTSSFFANLNVSPDLNAANAMAAMSDAISKFVSLTFVNLRVAFPSVCTWMFILGGFYSITGMISRTR